ncbi:6-phosphogluconate dehydrogenase (decarboxylating) [Buchnera aphidicola str. APS (Acyrthosiphon pisum)]|uniref:6-phosphogluconate dehydrogenase, decarboxylating n=1 Tax=Buchnera aphidicola subsp. Acyrthosiphon pisum (strain APS) TaxID=107806 RepID=6PGD_BUCAI|nr:NADP-dependent phosphogluconate dehydrogenase [Buchnera aphidicola]P57208.1 RecName: Full=6-phosphogluconate dehydrogenase, decarboxylating [Buchnera aphidicola str. APS (Acyrthosiphon pisum)]pir/B84942/ phosphogluconate dehydrogenase (decarboxylating) (EC 1.1.1.44) [imported] - Buchnera sp. (strain APS) [Buchnera sp. (in: enterobacteria)]BAB12826.1 6-phosphogluconate dehydrogenase (decarboxylating) [Buchnera aphidicola str. APS (Acyrthosiphon pisum)]
MSRQQIGVVGMAVMGRNLALNIESKNYSVSIFNRTRSVTEEVFNQNKKKNIVPYFSIKDFIDSLLKPRCILLMVQSGKATDETIKMILPYLEKEDILIDAGNTFYKDTIRRNEKLSKYEINFIGMGVSGGELGALNGPSIMPGGQKEAYKLVLPMLEKISAKFKGEPCVSYIGPNGAGHYVKMVHNGIEYGDMQLISESYFLLKYLLNMSNEELSSTFSKWNKGELNSYLIEITKNIFIEKDEKGKYLIDRILDVAEDKGTGKWISKSALDLREPLSLITESVFARYLSSLKRQRIIASKILQGPKIKTFIKDKNSFIEEVRRALYLGKIISYAQGFSQLKRASEKYHWNLKYGEIAKIFRAGCIIRANFLQKITDEYTQNKNVVNLLLTPYFSKIANEYENSLRNIVMYAIKYGISTPTFSAAISYYDSYRALYLPANLIQAQRDYFGSHTYQRTDQTGYFHTNWSQ